MAIMLYMDHHVPRAITIGLRLRGVDVITAYEDATGGLADPELLDLAVQLGRVLFTYDSSDLSFIAHSLPLTAMLSVAVFGKIIFFSLRSLR